MSGLSPAASPPDAEPAAAPRRLARWGEIGVRAAKSFGEHGCSLLAGGLTYYGLVSLFPLTLFALAVAGFVWHDPADRDALITNLLDALPLDAQSGRTDLERVLDSVVSARGTLGLIGLAGAAYSGSALFSAVRRSLNQVFEVEESRPFIRGKLLDLGLVAGFGLLLVLSLGATFAIAFAARFASDLFGPQAATLVRWSSALAYLLVPALVSALVFMLLYAVVAHAGVTWRQALGGVIVASAGFELLKVGFAQYVAAFGNYDATYGTLGFVIILLLFFYFSAQVLLFGAEIVQAGRTYRATPGLREISTIRATAARARRRVHLGGDRPASMAANPADAPTGAPADAGAERPMPRPPDAARPSPRPRPRPTEHHEAAPSRPMPPRQASARPIGVVLYAAALLGLVAAALRSAGHRGGGN